MFSGQEGIKNPHFLELDLAKGMPKTGAEDTVTDVLSNKFSWSGVYSSVTAPPNAISGEETPNSMQSSSAVASNCLDTALIDLKLGRFPDKKDVQFTDNPTFSSAQSSVPRKRARAGNLNSQTPFCQVEGCQKDLSASKDYNKRHKVCEVHSKTAKVYVNGTEQRFCQQCSRFHSLVEFDDGKRSCRKRLAGHNERRRKHHTGMHPGRRLIPSYNGIQFPGSSFAASSFVCQDAPHSSHLHPQRHEVSNWNRNPTDYAASLGIGNMKGKAHIKSHTDSFNSDKKSPPFHVDGLIPVTRTKENDQYNSFRTNMSSSDFDSLSLYQNTAVGSEELTVMDSSSSFQGLPPSSNSSCALSLLSCQSQTSPYISSSIPRALPLIAPSSHAHYSMVQVSDKLMGANPQTSTSGVSNVFPTSGITSADETHMDSLLFTDSMGSDKFGYNEFITGSAELMSTKNQLSVGDDSTIDLLELSSQLHHVEHERQSMQMKQQNDPFFGRRIT